ncbi:MAG: glucosaminidase domain-containing protein [Peptostreptococcaceae bacterium]
MMTEINNKIELKNTKRIIVLFIVTLMITITNQVILVKIRTEYNQKIQEMEQIVKFNNKELESYRYLYGESSKDIVKTNSKNAELTSELEYTKAEVIELRETIEASKQYDANNLSRGTLEHKPLTDYSIISIDEMNEWIAERAPSDSPFLGQGEAFLRAGKESGLDPKYIVAHAGLESTWGKSQIARDKFNFFGIGAFNHDPYNSAYTFNSFEDGIIEGAKWIKRNYTDNGQISLHSMIYGDPTNVYCVTDSGVPSQGWIDKIVNIILTSA